MNGAWQPEQRLARLKLLRNEVDLEIRQIEKDLRARERRVRVNVPPALVRRWALAAGHVVGARGRIPDDVVAAYAAAHPGQPA